MHVRFSMCRGLQIVSESTHELLGVISDVLLHPDTGRVEGFFVRAPHVDGIPFLAALDITRWGAQIHVRDPDAVYPIQERVRLQSLLDDPRRVIGQAVRTESGKHLGRCRDIQFSTETMQCEWLFPRRLLRWHTPQPLSNVVEVRPDAIIVRDQDVPVRETVREGLVSLPAEFLKQVPDAG